MEKRPKANIDRLAEEAHQTPEQRSAGKAALRKLIIRGCSNFISNYEYTTREQRDADEAVLMDLIKTGALNLPKGSVPQYGRTVEPEAHQTPEQRSAEQKAVVLVLLKDFLKNDPTQASEVLRAVYDLAPPEVQGHFKKTLLAEEKPIAPEGTTGLTPGPRPVVAESLAEEELRQRGESSEPTMSARETIERLKELRDRDDIQAFLDRFVVGKKWPSLEDNKIVSYGISKHLRGLDSRVECTADGKASSLDCWATTGNKTGSFYFVHHGGKPKHGGSPVVPPLRVVDAPEDLRHRKSGKTAP